MKKSEIHKIRTKAKKWPWFTGDWSDIPLDASSLAVDPTVAKSLEPLAHYKKLRQLFVTNVLRKQDVAHVAAVTGLRTLLVGKLASENIIGLSPLRHLESFGCFNASKLTSLSGFESLSALKHILLNHIPKVRSLKPISGLSNLEELVLESSMGSYKSLRFESLEPLSNLKRLKCVDLRGVRVEDGSLAPLASLPALRYLFPGTWAADAYELANLAAKLNHQLAREDQIKPTVKMPPDSECGKCKKCGAMQHHLSGRVGPRYRQFACPKCDKQVIAERHALFESARSRVMGKTGRTP